jgi:hypothetical protein
MGEWLNKYLLKRFLLKQAQSAKLVLMQGIALLRDGSASNAVRAEGTNGY